MTSVFLSYASESNFSDKKSPESHGWVTAFELALRDRLPRILAEVMEIARRYELPIANLFHAGDGNLHPMILFDVREPGILDRVMAAGREILLGAVFLLSRRAGKHRWTALRLTVLAIALLSLVDALHRGASDLDRAYYG